MPSLASDKGCNFIDHMDTFVSGNGEVIEYFLFIDGLHLLASGTRKLMHNLGVSDLVSGRLDAPKTIGSIWSRQSNHKRCQNLDSRQMTNQPPGRLVSSDHGQQGVTGHHRGEQTMVPQLYVHPNAHRKRNWYHGRNDGDSTPRHYQRQQGSQRSNDFHKDDHVKSYCELCGEINHTTQRCRHHNPINFHRCQRFGHKMKFCNSYRWIFGHGSHKTSRISDVDSNVDSCHCGKIADATCQTYLNINSRDNFIHASPRIEESASCVDINCVNVDYEGWVSYLLGRNYFWCVFEKRDVPEGSHCFIQSLILSLSTLSPDLPCLSYEHVLTLITNEIILNSEKFSSPLHDHGNSKVNEIINEYINNKNYDEHFGDLVPIITANAINNDLVII